MNLPKAINILDDMVNPENTIGGEQDKNAINLGIEALKRIRTTRFVTKDTKPLLLPGETEE